ncbi:hypothetical protein J4E90_004923 [Alternaria incomplexa]|uniref:uncharacterized protein n=1 Tax=Alternaria incomplexa TaxID=1187928 RepID=UPI00221EDCE6|nr:uncharacterized protein J4E90_004923 [Alternaria incomplexa]KAI4914887.1 hypothetical protein J4E90_004923 [Alternaria incomplexa]
MPKALVRPVPYSLHESGCKGEDGEITARFDGVFRVDYQKSMTSEAPCVLAVVRASSQSPKAWNAGEEHLADGIKIWAKNLFDEFANDYDSNEGINATLIAMSYVHTSVAPTGKFSQAHTTTDPTRRAYYARAHKFTYNIDRFLEHSTARGTKPIILSIGLDGFACKATLILPWLQRSPSFTLIVRETELVYGMNISYFPQHNSGFYYGFFESRDLLVGLSTQTAVDDGVKNLLAAWKACQDWKDYGQAHNGRLIGRNGDR